ncbi:hypothetical protein GCM10010425_53640 [Streptomyces spororaveus]|uniref:Uncharacterized protein n=1 Tax=Streptomyces spororaveus TaxID=284039 RepID=A0ABQ3T3X4_9ACTN|nr:hypothetical protein Sspor_06570 [Streptomyces spororaveus]
MRTTHNRGPRRVSGGRSAPRRGLGAGRTVAPTEPVAAPTPGGHTAGVGPPRREAGTAPEERVQDA